mgnify:CR=1 FL=1
MILWEEILVLDITLPEQNKTKNNVSRLFSVLFLQANNATLNAHTKPMVKAAKNAATVRMVEVVTTFQELVLAHRDGEVLCKYHILYFLL